MLNWNSFVEYKWFHHMSCLKYNIYHYKSWYLSPQVKYKMFHQKTCLKCKRFAKVLFQIQNLVLSTKCYTTAISWSPQVLSRQNALLQNLSGIWNFYQKSFVKCKMLTQKLFFNVKSFVKSLVLKYLILYNGHLLNGTSCNMEVLFHKEKWSWNVISRYSTLISCTLEQSILVSP